MTENIPQTSASDRIEQARKALAGLEADLAVWDEDQDSRIIDAIAALRALITPPSVGESVEQIAGQIMEDPYISNGVPIEQSLVREMVENAVRAGIQRAHERWEPADHPSQEQMLRWLGIESGFVGTEMDPHLLIPEQIIDREDI